MNHTRRVLPFALLLTITDELRAPGSASETRVERMVAQLVIELRHYCTTIRDTGCAPGLASWQLQRIDERSQASGLAPALSEPAQLSGPSVGQLARGFRASRGRPIGECIAGSHIDRAKQLPAGTRSVKAVAHAPGFSSLSSFCFAFRRRAGQTTNQYRHFKST